MAQRLGLGLRHIHHDGVCLSLPGGQQDGKPLVSSDQAVVPDVHDEGQDQAVFLNARVQGFILLVLGRDLHPGVIGGRFDVGQLDYSGFHASTPFRFGQ